MTAIYDGKISITEKGIDPCCKLMGDAITLGAIRMGTFQKSKIIKISISDRMCKISYCPFCGAEVM